MSTAPVNTKTIIPLENSTVPPVTVNLNQPIEQRTTIEYCADLYGMGDSPVQLEESSRERIRRLCETFRSNK